MNKQLLLFSKVRLYKTAALILTIFFCQYAAEGRAFFSALHFPRNGDRLHPAVSFHENALTISDSAKVAAIDISQFHFDRKWDYTVYTDGDTVSRVQNSTKESFTLSIDSIHYLAMENRDMQFSLGHPLPLTLLANDSSTVVKFIGRYRLHGSDALKMVSGTSCSFREPGWTITENSDTLSDLYRFVWNVEMGYFDADSLDWTMPDSVLASRISDRIVDMEIIRTERLRITREVWMSDKARYPVLERTSVVQLSMDENWNPTDSSKADYHAFYSPPALQYADTGDEEFRCKPHLSSRNENSGAHSDYNNNAGILIGEPLQQGMNITIGISAKEAGENATITLYSESGIVLSQPFKTTLTPIPQPIRLALPSGTEGVVLVRIETSNGVFTKKTLINSMD